MTGGCSRRSAALAGPDLHPQRPVPLAEDRSQSVDGDSPGASGRARAFTGTGREDGPGLTAI